MSIAVPLPSRLDVGNLAATSLSTAVGAARHPQVDSAALDGDRIALSYRSDRHLTIDGIPPQVWSPLSGFWQAADGWVRTHANYRHHASSLRTALGRAEDARPADLEAALARRRRDDVVRDAARAGALAVPVLAEDPSRDARLRRTPLVEMIPLRGGRRSTRLTGLGLEGIRVLDLTRVIAGPVCTRTLALLGADVLRIDPPGLPEPEWQHFDTGHGKRSSVLDARSPQFEALLAGADVVVLGYRPAALDRLGLSPAALAERHPDLIIAQLSAWGSEQPERRGFDSLVQAESGIALIESPDGGTPGALPAQALDHSAGYLLAAGVCDALHEGKSSLLVRTSLRRVAAELLGMPRRREPEPERDIDPQPHTQTFAVGSRRITTVRSAIPGLEFSAPRPWGQDDPVW